MMCKFFSCTAAIALFVIGSISAGATTTAANHTLDVKAANAARMQVQRNVFHAQSLAKKLGNPGTGTGNQPAEKFSNVDRAYPPSCLQSPLALGLYNNDPHALTAQITLPGDPLASDPVEQNYKELVNVTLFRVVCSGGESATLLEIDRSSANEGNQTHYPTLPGVSVSQGSNNIFIRMANDPNTFFSANYSLTPLVNSDVFILENFYGSAVQYDYNNAFSLTIDNFGATSSRYTTYPMAAYNPASYAEASLPLPISGYMSTNWSNPNQSGEGLVVQVYDAGDQANRILTFAWFTYDNMGLPFWLYGQATFPIGTRTLAVPTIYLSGGSFAPAILGAGVPYTNWGTATISFPDCGHMNVQFNGSASAVNGPTGSGNLTFVRTADVNSLVCQ